MRHGCAGEQFFQRRDAFSHPFGIRFLLGDALLNRLVCQQLPFGGVNGYHLPGSQASLLHNAALVKFNNTHLGAHDDGAVFGYLIPGGPQAVPIQTRADDDAVRERDGGGAVPRFTHAGEVFITRLQRIGHIRNLLVSFRNQAHHGMEDVPVGVLEEFQHVIQAHGVAAVRVDDRHEFPNLLLPER